MGVLSVLLFDELKRRNVLRVGAAYIITSWLLIQIAETIFPLFGFDVMPARIVVVVLVIGFVPTLVISWVFEFTAGGIKKERDIRPSSAPLPVVSKRLDHAIIVMLLAISYFSFDKFVLSPARCLSR